MRLKVLPLLIFFAFALVVAKVFDLALEKSSKHLVDIKSDIQAQAGAKTAKQNAEEPKAGDATKNAGETKGDTANEVPKDKAGGDSAQRQQNTPPTKISDISDKTPMEKALFESFAKRRMELDELANSISVKEGVLNAAEKKINSKMDELKKLQAEVSALLDQYNAKESEKNRKLVKIYEGMKPADAAKIFDTMDISILIDIISGMKEDNASRVIAKMNALKAKDLTTKLAEQRRLTTKN
jgi:flagellar motility protein MotE (MotC chaperone)